MTKIDVYKSLRNKSFLPIVCENDTFLKSWVQTHMHFHSAVGPFQGGGWMYSFKAVI